MHVLFLHASLGLQVRKRRELEIMEREREAVAADGIEDEKAFPFWRKKEFKLRELTRRIVELSKRQQLDNVVFLALWIVRKFRSFEDIFSLLGLSCVCISSHGFYSSTDHFSLCCR